MLCADDIILFHGMAYRVPDIHFIVTLQEVGPLHFRVSVESLWPLRNDQVEKLSQFVNVVIKTSALTRGCRSYGKARTTCYPHEDTQHTLHGGRQKVCVLMDCIFLLCM